MALHRLKRYFALSRTPHGLLDMTTPCAAAGLCLGDAPPLPTVLLGLLTLFAGYTAVYALNDVVDFNIDRRRLATDAFENRSGAEDLDSALVRHPMAQGLLTFREGVTWVVAWGAVAIGGAYLLNPFCAFLFLLGCALEAAYCLLFQVSPVRTLINGVVKTLGAVAAVYAVDPSPDGRFVLTLFFTLFLWEIGGQNIPNDCADLDEDRRLNARTVPVVFGIDIAAFAVVATLCGAALLSFLLIALSPAGFGPGAYAAVAVVVITLLLVPARRFFTTRSAADAMGLFNRASYFPAALFAIVFLKFFI